MKSHKIDMNSDSKIHILFHGINYEFIFKFPDIM